MRTKASLVAEPPADVGLWASEGRTRWSDAVFAVAAIAVVPVLLWIGRDHWFFGDEWWGVARSGSFDPGYLDGHNGHWLTLTRLQYRLTFDVWGLRTYLPYQLPVVVLHVGAAALLREVSRRCGVRGWIATTIAVAFVFFGTGFENILWGWQTNTTGALVCGLAIFLLGEGPPGALSRRDWLALALGVVGLMTSSAFVGIVVGAGVTIALRRGLRVAAFYTVPLALIYVVWYVRYGHDSAVAPLRLTGRTLTYVGHMFWPIFDGLAQGALGAVLLALAGVGLGSALYRSARTGDWAEVAIPAGLAVGWLAFAVMTALARAEWSPTAEFAGASRYVHVGAALLLPVTGLGAERLARRRLLLAMAALVPLAIGLPGNINRLTDTPPVFTAGRDILLAVASSPYLDDVPRDTEPFQDIIPSEDFDVPLTTGWLSRQVEAGRVPQADDADPLVELTATSMIVLRQDAGPTDEAACAPLGADVTVTLQRGDQLQFAGTVSVTLTDGTGASLPRNLQSSRGSVIRALAGPVDVIVRPAASTPARLCTHPSDP